MIDVIVPVRGAGPAFRRCAASLSRHVTPGSHRIVVVLDGPGDADAFAALDRLRQAGLDPIVLENPAPLGFPASVNRGMALSERDVVLLNSDTQVTAGWLDKLAAAAASAPDIATVTPFSNNATIASLPVFLAENTIPDGYDIDRFGALVEARSALLRPALPTGVGVCLYIRRAVLSAIGPFSEAFGLGYGEEVDFCLRASAAGFRHVLDDATFIFHEGHRSFGATRAARIRRAERRVRASFPHYDSLIHGFIQTDPIAPARERVVSALQPPRTPRPGVDRTPRRIVHVVHGWPPWAHGGTEHYAAWLARAQAAAGDTVVVYARVTDQDRGLGDAIEHVDGHGIRVRLTVNNFTQRDPLCRNGLHCRVLAGDFGRLLDRVRPDLVHVHHLAGHCASLLGVAKRVGSPLVYQAQDWWAACARVNLVNRDGALCPGPAPMRCARCLPLTSLPPAPLSSAALYLARDRWIRRQLGHVDAVVTGSRFLAETYAHWQLLPAKTPVHVVPYGVPALPLQPRGAGALGRPLRVGVVGALLPHKGVHVCVEAFAALTGVDAELHVWGSSDDARYLAALDDRAAVLPQVHLHGQFDEAERVDVLRDLDVLVVPSIGWESFGLSAREAWQQGVPVIASRLGALPELFADGEDRGGTTFTAGDATDLARVITRVATDPGLLDRWRLTIPPVVAVEPHARAIDAIYDGLIRQAR